MNWQPGRLILACVCCLTLASAASAQPFPQQLPASEILHLGDDAPHPSHRPLDSGVGDLSQAEDLLAHRLHRTHNVQDLQDLLKPFQDNPDLLKQLAGLKLKPDDLKKLEDVVKNNPSLLEDPKLGDLLGQMDKLRARRNARPQQAPGTGGPGEGLLREAIRQELLPSAPPPPGQ